MNGSNVTISHVNEKSCMDIVEDMAAPPPIYDMWVVAVITAILSVLPLLAVVGNTLVIVAVTTFPRLQTLTNTYIVSLAVADICMGCLVMPFEIYKQASSNRWMLGGFTCTLVHAVCVMLCAASIFNIACLTFDRYLAICRPMHHGETTKKRTVVVLIIASWVLPVFISFLPLLIGWNEVGIEDRIACVKLFARNQVCFLMVNKLFAVVVSFLAFYLPLIIILLLNWRIFHTAMTVMMSIRPSSSLDRSSISRRENKATKTVSVIMGCFVGCWTPYFVLNVIDPFIGYVIDYVAWCVALWLGLFNSVMNPFLLYSFNRTMRHAFRRLFARLRIRKSDASLSASPSGTSRSPKLSGRSHDSCAECSHGSHGSHIETDTPSLVPREPTVQ